MIISEIADVFSNNANTKQLIKLRCNYNTVITLKTKAANQNLIHDHQCQHCGKDQTIIKEQVRGTN